MPASKPKMSSTRAKIIAFFESLNCCGGSSAESYDFDNDDDRPALKISSPQNFRREDISILGLTPEEQSFIRAKAQADAEQMFKHLSPLASSPSGTFAERPAEPVTFEQFTTFPTSPLKGEFGQRVDEVDGDETGSKRRSVIDRARRHGRKISGALHEHMKPMGYQSVDGRGLAESKGLMEGGGKVSEDSYGSDGDSGKVLGTTADHTRF